ncbi:hypothetical protein [Algoriphagus winogradskyi]|jgi:hypothetical protein|uniref:Uncharacterized protein n=1 Tax=Algoriphagus winogradskyi TaxID=237017 RepID=A0ABY1NSL6_9BACT|nr:hypothetical protein [Algoriphagus winogradskyi]SMP16940.1 hypothetical protein SAMN06265367_102683 [Algoriphagus winogradskyi]
MTLCTAYIRQINDTEELVFATDSCLTGGEKWKHGIKLFELSRKDCLLCFAGDTMRAYPLVLNLVSSIHLDKYLESPATTLEEVLEFLSELFTKLVKTITEVGKDRIHEERGSAKFLFGGWDWQKGSNGSFRVWKLYYSSEVEGFIFDELTNPSTQTIFYTFMGNAASFGDIEKEAKSRFNRLLTIEEKIGSKLDMEPLRILSEISLDKSIREVDGSLQIAKIYKSNRTEFFGIYWESSKGIPCFQGREYKEVNKPLVRYFDPDTFQIIESDLPRRLLNISEELFLDNFEAVRSSFDEYGYLREGLSEKQKYDLRLIFKDVAYRQFIENQEKTIEPQEMEDSE